MKKLVCIKCRERARQTVLDSHEHEPGIVLKDVGAYECPKCHELIFTEKQMEAVERRTEAIKVRRVSLVRKLTVSGRSIVINLPEEIEVG